MIAVICRSQRQFDDFVKHWVCHEDRRKFHKVSRSGDIDGRWFTDVVRIGDYWELRDHEELYHWTKQRVRHGEA